MGDAEGRRSHPYASAINRLQNEADDLQKTFHAYEARVAEAKSKEQVLLRMVEYCDAVSALLQASLGPAGKPEERLADSVACPALARGGYSISLLQQVTWRQVQQVSAMTALDWVERLRWLFATYVVLLETITHSVPPAATGASGNTCSHASAPVGGSAASDAWRLADVVDDMITLAAVALLFNPLPLYLASSINLATMQPSVPPAGYWDRVAERVGYTAEQLDLITAAEAQFRRMNVQMSLRCTDLAERATTQVSRLLIRDDDTQGAATAAAAAPPPAAAAAAPPPAAAAAPDGGSCGRGGVAAAQGVSVLDGQLARHLHGIPLPPLLLLMFAADTLTKEQLATLNVASYPFTAVPGDVSNATLQRRQRQQQQPAQGGR